MASGPISDVAFERITDLHLAEAAGERIDESVVASLVTISRSATSRPGR